MFLLEIFDPYVYGKGNNIKMKTACLSNNLCIIDVHCWQYSFCIYLFFSRVLSGE